MNHHHSKSSKNAMLTKTMTPNSKTMSLTNSSIWRTSFNSFEKTSIRKSCNCNCIEVKLSLTIIKAGISKGR